MFLSQIKPLFERLKYQHSATALINQQGTYSFAELGMRTAAIAQALAPWAGRNVLVHGHKQLDAVAAMLACISQGCCFTFVDQANPVSRIEKIASMTRTELILTATTQKLEGLDRWPHWVMSTLENGDPASLPLKPELTQPVFYILPTSGSTGEPKGVKVSYENFAAFSAWYSPLVNDDVAQGCHVNHACFSFDMGILDLFPVLCQGRALLMLDHRHNVLPRQNIRLMSSQPECPVTSWFSTPSFVDLMLKDPLFSPQQFPELTRFFIAGERASLGLVTQLQARFPGLEVMHGYGPTETTCMTHTYSLGQPPQHNAGLLSLGGICGLNRIRIVDADGRSLPPGEMGEVRLYGPQVSLGYLPEDHPRNDAFSQDEFGRYYATGDRGFLDEDQSLFIYGRDDSQLKLHGNRIELAEIESSVCRSVEVTQCCVVPIKEEGKIIDLQLFIQLRDDNATHREALRHFLAEQLPAYMIPKSLFFCQDFPMTLHGKIDRQQLVRQHRALSALT
ncbi:AMP-binding protein [Pseudomonas sp. 6D_7.1_Bac1]|uniref:AMP-binding protein n=1 Tax=Pseudomonas sp. 6D_7.1_Bac1 TaxID=2971615 RepID=UPI0021CA31F0|nr:AMP-binding protein [Pseudomonas sp. 6D_7.1_Bac1]MCU1748574.1 AMP-binding protein [Pseudomonas sp. 6D_7.1_Bac1]